MLHISCKNFLTWNESSSTFFSDFSRLLSLLLISSANFLASILCRLVSKVASDAADTTDDFFRDEAVVSAMGSDEGPEEEEESRSLASAWSDGFLITGGTGLMLKSVTDDEQLNELVRLE